MPNSVSLPFNDLRTAPSATSPPYQDILPRDELRTTLLKALGGDEKKLEEVLNGERSVVNSCGSGMTAAVIWLALQELGVRSAIYDEVSETKRHLAIIFPERTTTTLVCTVRDLLMPGSRSSLGQDMQCGRRVRS